MVREVGRGPLDVPRCARIRWRNLSLAAPRSVGPGFGGLSEPPGPAVAVAGCRGAGFVARRFSLAGAGPVLGDGLEGRRPRGCREDAVEAGPSWAMCR